MKKIVCILSCCVVAAGFLFAEIDDPDATKMSATSAQQELKEISVDKFEQEGTWYSSMSSDEGIIKNKLFTGHPRNATEEDPNGKVPIPEEAAQGVPDEKVLGCRVDYFRRGYNSFFIYPAKALPIAGITKTVSVWVVGRNYNHTLKIMLQDYRGNDFELQLGKLNFQGWKKLTVAIPPQSFDGKHGIIQRDYHFNNKMGLKITGFKVECDPEDAYGNYYIYFDDLRAESDLYAETHRDEDDMLDNW